MATRKRDLGVDAHGRYRPCVGWYQEYRTDEVGRVIRVGARKQPRFNLGTDLKEAERRLARIRDLYEDNCKIMGSDLWSPQALAFAKEIARGERRITYPSFSEVIDKDDPSSNMPRCITTSGRCIPPSSSRQTRSYTPGRHDSTSGTSRRI